MSVFFIAAHALVLNENNRVLVTRRSKFNDYMPLYWDIPGGTIELGETVEQTLIRELKEETSIDITPIKPVYVYTNLSQIPNRQTIQIIYTCKYEGGDVVLNPEEHDKHQWMHYLEIKKLKCLPFLEAFLNGGGML